MKQLTIDGETMYNLSCTQNGAFCKFLRNGVETLILLLVCVIFSNRCMLKLRLRQAFINDMMGNNKMTEERFRR